MKLSDLKLDFKLINSVNKTGMASFLVQVAISFIAIMLRNLLARPLAVWTPPPLGILNAYLMYLYSLCYLGLDLGYAAISQLQSRRGKFARVRQALTKTIVYNTVFMVIVTVSIFVFSISSSASF